MKIAIVANMPFKGYSGGRYHAFILAQCLAVKNNQVFFITDTIPQFAGDFVNWPGYAKIHYIITKEFVLKQSLGNNFDFVIVVPTLAPDKIFCNNCENILKKLNGKLVILNFETPNWFNEYYPNGRKQESLDGIKELLHSCGGIVLSSTEISKKYAQAYYGTDSSKNIFYEVWNPAINSIAAEQSGEVKKEKRIVAMVRLKDRHKGGDDILKILSQPLRGYTVVLIIGKGKINREYRKELKKLCFQYDFTLEIKSKLSDMEKFREIKRAEILLFPTRFEGYGYPPIEAQYCNTLCITYDLPVLREISGDNVLFCEYGNVGHMKECLHGAIEFQGNRRCFENAKRKERGDCMIRSEKINDLLTQYRQLNHSVRGGQRTEWMCSQSLLMRLKVQLKYYLTRLRICFIRPKFSVLYEKNLN